MRQLLMSKAPATESIFFQSNAFFNELVLNFSELKKANKTEVTDSPIATVVSKVIKHHTGMDITLNIGINQPQVNIPMVNKNNILINSFIRNYLNSSDGIKMINESKSAVRGSVNLKTGMVSGIFAEVKSTIDLPTEMFTGSKYTPEEIAAITLHEVGHLFVYYEFMSRMVTTNQMLAGVSKALDNSGTVEERESVLINAKKAMNLTDLDAKTLAKSNDKKVAEIVIITNITKEVCSELGSNIYDFSTWEYLADQYAARHGAGRHLATSLEKIYKGSWNISFRSLPVYLAIEALKLLAFVLPVWINVGLGGALTSIGKAIFVLWQDASIMLIFMDSDNPTYDRPGERFKRIRDQIVENLKDKKLSKEDVEALNDDLVAIDEVLKDVNDRRQWLGALWDILSPTARKGRSQEMLQKDLENLAVNSLFEKAAELKLVA